MFCGPSSAETESADQNCRRGAETLRDSIYLENNGKTPSSSVCNVEESADGCTAPPSKRFSLRASAPLRLDCGLRAEPIWARLRHGFTGQGFDSFFCSFSSF